MKGVMIGEKHSYRDWDLYLGKETSISFPKIKETVVDIPGADNEIDLTEALTGDVKYKTRDIKLVFYTVKKKKNWKSFISEIANYLHGKKLNIIFDDDPSYFYVGRCQIDPLKLDEKVGRITIDVKAEAYKYSITSTTDDWLWDTFNFENGIIEYYSELTVNGTLELNLYNSRMRVIPTITVSNDMTIEFENETFELVEGINRLLDIELKEGDNLVKITGNGTVTIDYRRGCL